ncbi:DUF5082 family protein [Oceanobacillus sp. J11TS1]|uniref:YwqH-like family protein n=1 Tax=Oceanobacillus sp. J11TS1 TaxID=2807191 RepID=UPI001B08EE12|nr:DUF5082 family protein [Oceanobacillus sp. J11TS1]GIO23551.1 hypothetical protein J11TS1_21320 [Oceanobacillus sp. J11TS1]
MSESFVITNKLMMVDRSIGISKQVLSSKQDDLERLEKAHSELVEVQGDFSDVEGECSKPEFTSNNFEGENAKDVTEIREDGLKTSFIAMSEEQIKKVIEEIEEKIEQIEEGISSLESNISSMESRKEELEKKKEEARKNE